MSVQTYDFKGLKCPGPALKLTALTFKIDKGTVIELLADCPTFEDDIRGWCERNKKVLIWIREEGKGVKKCQIQF